MQRLKFHRDERRSKRGHLGGETARLREEQDCQEEQQNIHSLSLHCEKHYHMMKMCVLTAPYVNKAKNDSFLVTLKKSLLDSYCTFVCVEHEILCVPIEIPSKSCQARQRTIEFPAGRWRHHCPTDLE